VLHCIAAEAAITVGEGAAIVSSRFVDKAVVLDGKDTPCSRTPARPGARPAPKESTAENAYVRT
ncbi:MAG: hypothetical protein ABJ056_03800, partial [Halioglobus sp.]